MKHKTAWLIIIILILSTVLISFQVSAEEVTSKDLTLEFASGSRTGKYSGTLVDGLPSGKGKFESQNSEGTPWYYEGDFLNGIANGNGTIVFNDGTKYEGIFDNGQMNGYGKYYKSNQLVYEGNWVNSNFSGQGKLYGDNQTTFEGEFKAGKIYEGNAYQYGKTYAVHNGKVEDSLSTSTSLASTFLMTILLLFGAGFMFAGAFLLFKFAKNPKSRIPVPATFTSPAFRNAPVKQTVKCKNCGATNCIILGSDVHCEYCDSPLK